MLRLFYLCSAFLILLTGCEPVEDPDEKNKPPEVTINAGNLSIVGGEPVEVSATATDSDGSIVSYQWTHNASINITLTDEETQTVTINTPTVNSTSQFTLTVMVTDDKGGKTSSEITVSVTQTNNENQPPSVSIDGGDSTVTGGQSIQVSATASDSDGRITGYEWEHDANMNVTLTNADTNTVTVNTPAVNSNEQFTLTVTVTDDQGARTSSEITISVTRPMNENQPPTVSINNGNLSVIGGRQVQVTATATDSDGTINRYNWQHNASINVMLTNANSKTVTVITPAVNAASEFTLTVTVTDDEGATANDNIKIKVTDDNTSTAVIWPNEHSSTNGDQWLRDNHDRITELRPAVLVVDMDLNIPDARSNEVSQKYAHAFAESTRFHGYKNPDSPARVNPQIKKIVHMKAKDADYIRRNFGTNAEKMGKMAPLFTQQFADYIGWKDPENPNRNMTLCELFERGFINEYWSHGLPTAIFETQSHQQVYNDKMQPIPGRFNDCANGCVDLGQAAKQCKVTMRFSFVNPRRGTGCDVHGHGHMMENMGHSLPELKKMNDRFWGHNIQEYYPNLTNFRHWGYCEYNGPECFEFPTPTSVRNTSTGTKGSFHQENWGKICGQVHFSPNSGGHYDYNDSVKVANSCENYGMGNGENGEDKRTLYNYDTVSAVDRDPRYSDCGGGWQMYLRQSMPGYKTKARNSDGTPMRNWWPYLYY